MPTFTPARSAVAVIAGASLAFGGALIATVPAAAAVGSTYYVDAATGDDSTGDGTSGLPFATIAKGVAIAVDGDTVSVAAGSYTGASVAEDLTITGAGAGSIVTGTVILSAGAEGATLSGFHFTSDDNQIWAVGLDGTDVTTIDGNLFDMPTNPPQPNSVLNSSAKGLTISNNTFVGDGSYGDAVSVNFIGGGIEDVVVTGNTSTGYGNFVVANANVAGGLTGLEVTANIVHDTLGTAIFIGDAVDDVDISGNLIEGGGSSAVSFTYFTATPDLGGAGPDLSVTGNTFTGNLRGINVNVDALAAPLTATANAFYGNATGIRNLSDTAVNASGSVWSIPAGPLATGDDAVTGAGANLVTTAPVAASLGLARPGATSNTVGLTTTVHLGISDALHWFTVGAIGVPSSFDYVQADAAGDVTVTWPAGTASGVQKVAIVTGIPSTREFVAASIPAPSSYTSSPTPSISGYATVGRTLTAITRTWAPAGATLTSQWNADGVALAGQTGSTLVLTPALAGKKITLTVTATRAGEASISRTSAPTAAVALGTLTAPVPTIAGSRTVGAVLTATPGTWGPVATTLTYRWTRNLVVIPGATGSTYTQVAADLNKVVGVIVTGTAPGYAPKAVRNVPGSKTGAKLVGTPTSITLPAAPSVGKALAITTTGSWQSGATLTYQWRVAGVAVPGATKSTYVPLPADIGKPISVFVYGAKPGFTKARMVAPATAPVVAGTFVSPPVPVITAAKVGYPATVTLGTWTPKPTSYRYQWAIDGVDVVGATAATFNPRGADLGKTLTVKVTAVRTGFTSSTVSSLGKVVASGVFSTTEKPKITGTARVGRVLTATTSGWVPSGSYSYQWKLDGVIITGAVDDIYTVSPEDVGGRLTVTVTGSRVGFVNASETSNPTAVVTP